MKFSYDPEVDVLRVIFRKAPVVESDAEKPGLFIDYDAAGNIVGLEILDASRRADEPERFEHAEA